MKRQIIILLIITLTLSAFGQDIELFKGENKLTSCKVDIPLTYKKKDKPAYLKGAIENKDTKLVLLNYNKKTNVTTYSYYYIVVNDPNGDPYVYLETPENHSSTSGQKQSLFVPFKIKFDRFYKADCFDKILTDNPDLKNVIKKE